MKYQLTEVTDVCNAGANVNKIVFDEWYELEDYIMQATENMDKYERECYMADSKIDTIYE
jgi:hypothetical protein